MKHQRTLNPITRMTRNLPRGWRIAIDWVVTIVGAIAIVLAIKAWVVNPYRIPSSSMEPTLHCARPGPGCEARFSDRVLANRFIYHFRKPHRGDIIVFKTPPLAKVRCGAGGTFVKRLVALPGETWQEKNGSIYINGKKLIEPYVKGDRRDIGTSYPARKIPLGDVLHDGRQPLAVVRLPRVGAGAAQEPDRRGVRRLLAAEPHRIQIAGEPMVLPLALSFARSLRSHRLLAANGVCRARQVGRGDGCRQPRVSGARNPVTIR